MWAWLRLARLVICNSRRCLGILLSCCCHKSCFGLRKSLRWHPHSHVSVSEWVGKTSKIQDEQTGQTEDARDRHSGSTPGCAPASPQALCIWAGLEGTAACAVTPSVSLVPKTWGASSLLQYTLHFVSKQKHRDL